MFQNLRVNSQIYLLHKDGNPYVEYGTVTNVTAPRAKYPMSPTPMGQFPQVETVVDVMVNIRGQQVPLKDLKANADVDDNGKIIVSCSRDAINSEVAMMRQKSLDILNSIEYHKNVIACCDKMLNTLNPEIAAKQEQEQRIQGLEQKIDALMGQIARMCGAANKPEGPGTQKTEGK